MSIRKRPFFGYYVVVALVLTSFVPLSLGLSCAGIFYPAISADLGIGKGLLGYYTSVLWFAALVTLPVMGRLLNKNDARVCLAGPVSVMVVAFVWLSFMHEIWQFYVGAFLMGVGVGMLLFLAPSTLVNRWFSRRAGFLLGIVMAFTGIGGVVWSSIGGVLIQQIGWQSTYLVFAVLSACTLPACVFLVRSRPSDLGLAPWGGEEPVETSSHVLQTEDGVSAHDAFRAPVFYLILAMALLLNFGMYLYFMIPSYLSALPVSLSMPLLGATASSVAMAGQTVSKIVLGYVGDRRPYAATLVTIALGIVGVLVFASGAQEAVLIYGAAFVYGAFYGITNVMTPIITRVTFGNRDYARIYSRVSMAASMGSMVSGFIWGTAIEVTGGFDVMFAGIVAMMVVTMGCVVLIWRLGRR